MEDIQVLVEEKAKREYGSKLSPFDIQSISSNGLSHIN